jgi:hypothetical protein
MEVPWKPWAESVGLLSTNGVINDAKISLSPQKGVVSNKLAYLNQASQKFWANADRDDRATHPKNVDVEAWLVVRGYSQTLAEKAATIVRPEWAETGRKPEK